MRGSIAQRSPGSWRIVLDVGTGPDGRRQRHTETFHGPKREAEKRLAKLLHEHDTGGMVKPTKETVASFLTRWLDDYGATNLRARTAEGYRHKIERHVLPRLGAVPLATLTAGHLQGLYRELLANGRLDGKGGLSARSVLHIHRILHDALGHAVRWGALARNPAQAVDPPRAGHKEMQVLDSEGVHRLLEAARGTEYHPLLHLAIYTGLRRSELLGLRWKDVDLDMAALYVVQTAHHLRDGRIVYQEPKTAKGKRQVSLSPTAVLALRAHRERVEAERALLGAPLTPDSLVFSHPDGSPMLPDSVSHAFLKLARRIGLQGVHLHTLRHSHATMMLRANVHPKVVQERLGHSQISVTLDTYSHVVPGMQERAALAFDDMLTPRRPALAPAEASPAA